MFTIAFIAPSYCSDEETVIIKETALVPVIGHEMMLDGLPYEVNRILWKEVADTYVLFVKLVSPQRNGFLNKRIEQIVADHLLESTPQ